MTFLPSYLLKKKHCENYLLIYVSSPSDSLIIFSSILKRFNKSVLLLFMLWGQQYDRLISTAWRISWLRRFNLCRFIQLASQQWWSCRPSYIPCKLYLYFKALHFNCSYQQTCTFFPNYIQIVGMSLTIVVIYAAWRVSDSHPHNSP